MSKNSRAPMTWMLKYIAATYAYSIAHTVGIFWNTKRRYSDLITQKRELKPMLIMDKFGAGLLRFCVAPGAWPLYLYNDASRLEFYLRGIDPRAYGFDPEDELF